MTLTIQDLGAIGELIGSLLVLVTPYHEWLGGRDREGEKPSNFEADRY